MLYKNALAFLDKPDKIINRIEKNMDFTEEELEAIVKYGKEVDEIEGEVGRWDQSIQTVVEINERYFAIDWLRGLTEYQMDSYPFPPYEVKPEVYEKVIKATRWNPTKNERS